MLIKSEYRIKRRAKYVQCILVNSIIGVGMILMNRKYTNGLDEMQRKVAMDAMAIAFGVSVVGGMSYSMLDAADVISFNVPMVVASVFSIDDEMA